MQNPLDTAPPDPSMGSINDLVFCVNGFLYIKTTTGWTAVNTVSCWPVGSKDVPTMASQIIINLIPPSQVKNICGLTMPPKSAPLPYFYLCTNLDMSGSGQYNATYTFYIQRTAPSTDKSASSCTYFSEQLTNVSIDVTSLNQKGIVAFQANPLFTQGPRNLTIYQKSYTTQLRTSKPCANQAAIDKDNENLISLQIQKTKWTQGVIVTYLFSLVFFIIGGILLYTMWKKNNDAATTVLPEIPSGITVHADVGKLPGHADHDEHNT